LSGQILEIEIFRRRLPIEIEIGFQLGYTWVQRARPNSTGTDNHKRASQDEAEG
jgi:hypothetical protein